jgi:hypothetical protein
VKEGGKGITNYELQITNFEKDGEINIYFRKAVQSIKEMRGSISGGRDLSKTRAVDLLDEEFRVH